jgi:murein L,D-transpeptidase YafK
MTRISWFVTCIILAGIPAAAKAEVCSGNLSYLEVNISEAKLFLCDHGRVIRDFRVSLGRGGIDKKVKGDARTPIGKYELGTPRPSSRFIKFIPIGYPTEQQRQRGFTGSDVGVHGPLRYLSWLGGLNTIVNWTNGCIAVGSEAEISEVADWVNANHVTEIVVH